MEVKLNAEIMDYTEQVYFGLSLRQFLFSLLAVGVAVGLYGLLHPLLAVGTLSWVCMLGAAPFAVLGFVRYHGMPAEAFLWAWVRFQILEPKRLGCRGRNLYYEAMKDTLEAVQEGDTKSTC